MCRKLKGLPEYRLITRWLFRNSAFAFLALALFSTVFSACASTDQIDASTVEGAYQLAERLEKDERFEEAIIKYTEVKNKHPYSRFALLAELKIADVQFTRESYIEAQYAYQTFKDLHPKHAQIDYVTYRLGLSFFNQLPSTIDRDLSLAEKAILYFDEVTTSYSSSEYSKDAASKKADALKMLAQKEMYIADFYFKKRQFDSALGRYENVLKRYANVDGMAPIALLGAARSAKQTGDRDKVNRFVQMLVSKFPQTSEADKARSELPDVR
jgi:outer membrane protein assembly factor BamD